MISTVGKRGCGKRSTRHGLGGAAGICVLAAICAGACSHAERAPDTTPATVSLPRPIGGSPDQPPTAAIIPGGAYLAERNRCIDTQLSRRGLNEFGDPLGTTYVSGSPLVDAVTGEVMDRHAYVMRHRPDIASTCSRAPGEPRP